MDSTRLTQTISHSSGSPSTTNPSAGLMAEITEEQLLQWLQERVSGERFFHSQGAQQKSDELARFFKLNALEIQQARWAGLLHDCAKLMSPDELLTACQQYKLAISDVDRLSPQTLHPFVGAEMVKQAFNITDEDLLNAIRYHTTGRAGMSKVEKIVYVADKIEGNTRNPLYTQKITQLITSPKKETLDKVTLYILDSTITFLIEKGQYIHPRTLEARNELVGQTKRSHSKPSARTQ